MPTIASLVSEGHVVSTPTPADILWCNQGASSDRDKAITSKQVVAGGIPAAVEDFPSPTSPDGSEVLFLSQESAGTAATVAEVFDIMAANAPDPGDFDTHRVLVADVAGYGGSLPISKFQAQVVDLAKRTTSEARWDSISTGGIDTDWSDCMDDGAGWLLIRRSYAGTGVDAGMFELIMHPVFAGFASSSSNSGNIVLEIPESAFPAGWYDEIHTALNSGMLGGPYFARKNNSAFTNGYFVATTAGTSPNRYIMVDFGALWSTLMPTNLAPGAWIHAAISVMDTASIPAPA